MPVMTYFNKQHGTSIWRCAQPMNGIMGKRNQSDELILQTLGSLTYNQEDTGLNILDARPYMNAQANKFGGGGFEKVRRYSDIKIHFLGIDNIHAVSKAFARMFEIQRDPASFES